jgi:hypothetical protein
MDGSGWSRGGLCRVDVKAIKEDRQPPLLLLRERTGIEGAAAEKLAFFTAERSPTGKERHRGGAMIGQAHDRSRDPQGAAVPKRLEIRQPIKYAPADLHRLRPEPSTFPVCERLWSIPQICRCIRARKPAVGGYPDLYVFN